MGLFDFGSHHFLKSNLTKQGDFAVTGIVAVPESVEYEGFPEIGSLEDAFSFQFLGKDLSFSNVLLDVDPASAVFGLTVDYTLDARSAVGAAAGDESPGSYVKVSFTFDARDAFPVRIPVYFTVSTDEGDTLRTFVDVTIRSRLSDLVVKTPDSLDILVDMQATAPAVYAPVVLTNNGSKETGVVSVLIPEDQEFLKIVSDPVIPSIEINAEATVSLAFKAPSSTAVGTTYVGTILFASSESSSTVPFKVTVVSSRRGTLTIITEDEFTFFASDTPNLANVQVQITSQPQGESESLVTDEDGIASFLDLSEGFYDIVAQKLGHSSYRGSIYFSPPGMSVPVFLSRNLVSYTFTVVEVPVTETYVINVRSTFETNVPAPVVVFEPLGLDLESLTSGEVSEIIVTATNHGLIAADVSINFSDRLANVVFESPEEQIGTLPAKSSATYSVNVKPLLAFELPPDRVELRKGNNIILLRIPLEESASPVDEISVVIIPADDPYEGQVSVVFNATGDITSIFGISSRLLLDFPTDGSDPIETDLSGFPVQSRNDHYFGPPLQERPTTSLVSNPLESIGVDVLQAFAPEGRSLLSLCISCDTINMIIEELVDAACSKFVDRAIKCVSVCSRLRNPVAIGACGFACTAAGSLFCDELKDLAKDVCNCPSAKVEYCYTFVCRVPIEICVPKTYNNCTFCAEIGGGGGDGGPGRLPSADAIPGRGISICGKVKTKDGARDNPVFRIDSDTVRFFDTVKNVKDAARDVSKLHKRAKDVAKIASKRAQRKEYARLGAESYNVANNIKGVVEEIGSTVSGFFGQRRLLEDEFLLQNPGLLDLVLKTVLLEDFGNLLGFFFEYNEVGEASDSEAALVLAESLAVAISEDGDEGAYISPAEFASLPTIDIIDVALFAERWNATILFLETGDSATTSNPFDLIELERLIDKFTEGADQIEREARGTLPEAWASALEGQQIEAAKRLAGVCASVQLLIEQELTLTRVGFEAQLDIRNAALNELQNVSVTLNAILSDPTGFGDATDMFVFGDPQLSRVSSVDGDGTLGPDNTGRVTWLILPLPEAAPQFETRYQIGGRLSYTIDGDEFVDNLVPATIAVKPGPRLHLTYFHSRIAYSDDPFTDEIEPPIPFYLGLLLENRGYGDAFDVRIVSAQPNITENEKGLLVDFEILQARVGNKSTDKSLEITFGAVPARENRVGVWEMISSLTGTFYNFSASFEYNGPIDDDRLSLIESVDIIELTQLVRVVGDHPRGAGLGFVDDDLDDFLVNEFPDADSLPDTVYTSDTQQAAFSVARRVDVYVPTKFQPSNDETEMRVTVELDPALPTVGDTDWVYIRFDDPMARSGFVLHSAVDNEAAYALVPNVNSWQTSRTEYLVGDETNELDFIHLFDLAGATEYELIYKKVVPVAALEAVAVTTDSAIVSWEPDDADSGSSFEALVKPKGSPDRYFKSSGTTLRTLYTISSLDPGREYDVRILTGDSKNGTTLTIATPGESLCGNGAVDGNEECDEGASNDDLSGPCTTNCVPFIAPITLEIVLTPEKTPSNKYFASDSDDLLWVTILSTATHDVSIIDLASLRCGKEGIEASVLEEEPCVFDANEDGLMDWQVSFRASELGFAGIDDNLFDESIDILLMADITSGFGQFSASQLLSFSSNKKSKGDNECKASSKDTKGSSKSTKGSTRRGRIRK